MKGPVLQQSRSAATEDDSEEENMAEDLELFDAQFAMTACEISLFQAVSGQDGDEWRDAVYAEIKSLVSNAWSLVDRPDGEKVIGCRTMLRNKYKANGELERRKVRVVARGFSQRPDVDFHDTFAPVARLSSLKALLAASVEQEMLQEMLERIIAVESDAILIEKAKRMLYTLKKGNKVCKLKKAIYGLRQAGRQWHERLDKALRKLGLTPTRACTTTRRNGH